MPKNVSIVTRVVGDEHNEGTVYDGNIEHHQHHPVATAGQPAQCCGHGHAQNRVGYPGTVRDAAFGQCAVSHERLGVGRSGLGCRSTYRRYGLVAESWSCCRDPAVRHCQVVCALPILTRIDKSMALMSLVILPTEM